MSKHSNKIDEFYATSQSTAAWLVDKLREIYGLEGKTAFELDSGVSATEDGELFDDSEDVAF